jgi:hypothetical protein
MQLRTEIEILAPRSAVWKVLADFPGYAEWNPFIPFISGEQQSGARLEIILSPPDGREMTIRPTLVTFEPEAELRWRGHLLHPAVFQGIHFFKLTELEPNRTRLTHGEDFSGFLVKFLSSVFTKAARGFVFMNQALKKRVEGAAPR